MSKKIKIKKKTLIILLVSVIVVGLLASAIGVKLYSNSFVKVARVDEVVAGCGGYYGETMLEGKIAEGSVQNVKIKDGLKVKEIKVEKGDEVKKGDVLIEYDKDTVALSVEQYQTQIEQASNSIKKAENELAVLMSLVPSENAPETDSSATNQYEKSITVNTPPLSGDGSENSPFVFDVGKDSVVTKQYMQYLAGDMVESDDSAQSKRTNSKFATFHVHDENGDILYSWLVDGSKITESDINDWHCNSGVEISANGDIVITQGTCFFAKLITRNTLENGSEINADESIADTSDNGDTISFDDNYKYTSAQIQEKISEKNKSIEDANFNKRQAEIGLKEAEKTLESGNEVANISGKVTFVAKSEEDAKKSGKYITITNDSATTVIASVSEKDLPSIEIGMEVDAIDANYTGSGMMGTVTDISDEPSSNIPKGNGYSYIDSNAMYYDITVELNENPSVDLSDGVYITLQTDEQDNLIQVPTAFVRSEYGKLYVMVANENNVLEKRYVEVGDMDPYTASILKGLSMEDRIALPYGNAVEGAPTRDVPYEKLQSNGIMVG